VPINGGDVQLVILYALQYVAADYKNTMQYFGVLLAVTG
jgi:hypothetical protein